MKYYIKTYGCQMNEADSQRLAGVLEAAGYDPASAKAAAGKETGYPEADIVLVNTCCVRKHAEDVALQYVASLKGIKKKNPGMKIGLCGCIVSLPNNDLKKHFPHVDFFLPPNSPALLLKYLNIHLSFDIGHLSLSKHHNIDTGYVSIMTGCNNYCSYCVVPYVRGRETSRPMDEVLAEIKSLLGSGVTDITLLGQNVNSYKYGLAELLREIGMFLEPAAKRRGYAGEEPRRSVSGSEPRACVNFLTSHPRDMSDEIIETVAKLPFVAREFLLPLQSGDDTILTKMNRGYTLDHYLGRINKIRSLMPQARISSDIIVGFPGETEAQFKNTLKAVKQIRFDHVHMFAYSARPETIAAKMSGQLSDAIKRSRLQKLISVVREIVR